MLGHRLTVDKLAPFADAVAGHDGVLCDEDRHFVIKPCTEAEIAFYTRASGSFSPLKTVMPLFYGTLSLASPETAKALGEGDGQEVAQFIQQQAAPTAEHGASPALPLRGKKLDTTQAIVLENLAAAYERPNIMDIKLGIRLWADDASPEKRRKLDGVSAETTSGSLGLRVAGMKVWQPHHVNTKDEYKIYDKYYGRQFDDRTVRQPFKEFLYERDMDGKLTLTPARRKIVEELLSEVTNIEKLFEVEDLRMYSASILLVFEGNPEALVRAEATEMQRQKKILERARMAETVVEEDERFVLQEEDDDDDNEVEEQDNDDDDEDSYLTCSANLIDFAHAAFTPGLGPDENTLRGVRNVRLILDSLLRQP